MRGVRFPALGWSRKALDDNPAQSIEIDHMGELDPIAKSAAGSDDGILERQGTDFNPEVNPRGPGGAPSAGVQTPKRAASVEFYCRESLSGT